MEITNIKEFVAYKFEDIEDVNLAHEELIWTPVLFPYHPDRNLYFITLSISCDDGCFARPERKKLRDLPRSEVFVINSIYDACGYHPSFLIVEAKSPNNLRPVITEHTNPRYMSLATPEDIVKRFGINKEDFWNIKDENVDLESLEQKIDEIITEITSCLFSWDNVPGNDSEKLLRFLRDDLDISWAENGINPKRDDSKTISISKDENSAKIIIGNKEKKATLKISDGSTHDLKVKNENGKRKLYRIFSKNDIEKKFEDISGWKEFIRFVPMNMNKVISIVLIHPPDDKTKDKVIDEIKEDERIIDAYEVIGESRLLIKIITEDLNEVFSYIESLMKRKTHAMSKIMLCTAKENGVPFFDKFPTPKLENTPTDEQKDILRYLWENPKIIFDSRKSQIKGFQIKYEKYRNDNDLKEKFEGVEDDYIYKYSTKLEQPGWFKALLFIKNSFGGRQIIWNSIRNNLLDVDKTFFSRKFYAVTGDFDFIVPMDFHSPLILTEKIKAFLDTSITNNTKNVGEYVNDIKSYFEEESSATAGYLEDVEISAIKTMMPNLRDGVVEGEKIPRSEYYKYHLNKLDVQNPPVSGLVETLKVADAMPTIELHSEKLVHAFVRFKIKKEDQFEKELNNLKKDSKHIFLYRMYKPFHNPGSKMFILATEDFYSLHLFVSSLDKYSRNTVTSLIFMQDYYRPDIPKRLRCKPCRLPLGERCDACPQYIKSPKRIDVRYVDLKIMDYIEPCKIAVVQLNMPNLEPLVPRYNGVVEPGEIMDKLKEKVIKRLNEAIEEKYLFSSNTIFEADSSKSVVSEELKNIFKSNGFSLPDNATITKRKENEWVIANEEKFIVRKKRDDELNIYKAKADIVVFPEMSIPENLIEEIKETIKGQKIFVIAGTHLHQYDDDDEGGKKKYYNTCPVLISDGTGNVKQYEVHRNELSSDDQDVETNFGIVIEEGRGMLRFRNTGFGDFTVLICLDFVQNDMLMELFKKIDFLIVPSWNRDTDRFRTHAVDVAREKWWFVALANNGIYGQSGLYAPYKGHEWDGLNGRIHGTNVEGVEYYTIDVLDLDRARDGSIRTRKDKNIEVSPEEERIANKFRKLGDLAIEPRHRKLWENKKEESEE